MRHLEQDQVILVMEIFILILEIIVWQCIIAVSGGMQTLPLRQVRVHQRLARVLLLPVHLAQQVQVLVQQQAQVPVQQQLYDYSIKSQKAKRS